MARWLACLVLWMAMTAALAAPQAAKVQYAFHGSAFSGYKVDDGVFVTPATAKSWGWNVDLRGNNLHFACEGRQFHLPVVNVNNERHFNLTEAAGYLGAKTVWDGDTYRVLASIRSIQMTDKGVEVASTIQTQPRIFKLASPDRLVLDFHGAELEAKLVQGLPGWWRVAQFGKDVVRVVIEHPGVVAASVSQPKPGRLLAYDLPLVCLKDPAQVSQSELIAARQAAQPSPSSAAGGLALIEKPYVQRDTDTESVVHIPVSRDLTVSPTIRYVSPTQLQITVPKAQIVDLGGGKLEGSRWIKDYNMAGNGENALLMVETTQPMAFSFATAGKTIVLRLFRPKASSGTMAGKVIVIDPGHGGRDPGARFGNVSEKSLALPISLEIASQLSAAGASVIMTRMDDSYPSLGDRSRIANESNADIFISVHINSNTTANSRSGTITFYHQEDAVGRLLAECLHAEIVKQSNIPNIGVWSDRRIYQSGFAVLRNSQMPGVLLELGFINHAYDRAEMSKKDFPARMASAVVQGVKNFLGQSAAPARPAQPQNAQPQSKEQN